MRAALPGTRGRQRRWPTRSGERHRRHRRRQDGRIPRASPRPPAKNCKDVDATRLCRNTKTTGCHGLPHRRATSRTTGPMPRTSCSRTGCSNRTRRGACRRTCSWFRNGRRTARSTATRAAARTTVDKPGLTAGLRAGKRTAAKRPPPDLRVDRPHVPAVQAARLVGLLRGAGYGARLRERLGAHAGRRRAEREDPGDLEPAAVLRHGGRRTASSATSRRSTSSTRQRRRARCPRCRGSCRPAHVSEHPPSPVSDGQSYVTEPGERGDERGRSGTPRRSSSHGTTGAGSTTTWCRRASTRTATGCACPGIVISPYAPPGLRRPPDAVLRRVRRSSSKTTFSAVSGSIPRTDGRPDPRPDVRERREDPRRPHVGLRSRAIRRRGPDAQPPDSSGITRDSNSSMLERSYAASRK